MRRGGDEGFYSCVLLHGYMQLKRNKTKEIKGVLSKEN